MKALRSLVGGFKRGSSIPAHVRRRLSPSAARAWREVRREHLTYLSASKLASLLNLCLDVEERGEPGDLLEAGCALGGSAIMLCATKSRNRPLRVYDVFGMIPAPGDRDGDDVHARYDVIRRGESRGIGGDEYYGYQKDLYETVRRNFVALGYPPEENAVELIQGLVQDTLSGSTPVALAHVDVDWYEPVMTCLERIVPRLAAHGAVVLDDYRDWSGCRRAANDFFDRVGRSGYSFDDSAGHLVVRKLPG